MAETRIPAVSLGDPSTLNNSAAVNLRSGPFFPPGPRGGTGQLFLQIPLQSLADQEKKKGLIAGYPPVSQSLREKKGTACSLLSLPLTQLIQRSAEVLITQKRQRAQTVQTDQGVEQDGAPSPLLQGKQRLILQHVNHRLAAAVHEVLTLLLVADVQQAQSSRQSVGHPRPRGGFSLVSKQWEYFTNIIYLTIYLDILRVFHLRRRD